VTARTPKRARDLLTAVDAEYERLLAAQGGGCAICGATPKTRRLHVDHDHMDRAHRVRGLLCMRCNRALPTWITADWLIRAALYVDPQREDALARGRAFAYALYPEAL